MKTNTKSIQELIPFVPTHYYLKGESPHREENETPDEHLLRLQRAVSNFARQRQVDKKMIRKLNKLQVTIQNAHSAEARNYANLISDLSRKLQIAVGQRDELHLIAKEFYRRMGEHSPEGPLWLYRKTREIIQQVESVAL